MDNNLSMSFEEMYEAIISNDESYDNIFFYGVKSTGIYCKPSCKSRPPKIENVNFFKTSKEAVKAGYRSCKRCRSDLLEYQPGKDTAIKIKSLIEDMFYDKEKLDIHINNLGLSKKRIVEVFKEEYAITPREYINDLRYKKAIFLLENTDKKIIDIAYEIGFSSLSAFYNFFKQRKNVSPSVYRKGEK